MNIFLTSDNAKACALALDDKRVVKMALETAQLLSGAVRLTMPAHADGVYRLSHENHPCAKWTRQSLHNFLWLYDHGIALCEEYSHRFERRHKSQDVIQLCYEHLPVFGACLDDIPLAFTFNSSGWIVGDVFHSYRLCMMHKWLSLDTIKPRWTHRDRPSWYNSVSEEYSKL